MTIPRVSDHLSLYVFRSQFSVTLIKQVPIYCFWSKWENGLFFFSFVFICLSNCFIYFVMKVLWPVVHCFLLLGILRPLFTSIGILMGSNDGTLLKTLDQPLESVLDSFTLTLTPRLLPSIYTVSSHNRTGQKTMILSYGVSDLLNFSFLK